MAKKAPPQLVVDIAPLWELQYTGISNVVREIALRSLAESRAPFRFAFSAFEQVVPPDVIARCVEDSCGTALREHFNGRSAGPIYEDSRVDLKRDTALFLHVKPPFRRFRKEAHLYYDLSYLSVPETHAQDTIDFHKKDLSAQIRSTDQFFTISESTALDLSWYFDIPREKIEVTYLGHNTDIEIADEFVAQFFGRKIEPYVLCLGTIEPRKNISLILEWLAKSPTILQTCRFIFCGREGWGASFSDLIAGMGLEWALNSGRIAHFGYVTQRQKAALLAGAEALVYPSLFEGFGLPILEAMAQSIPVIASCSTSIPEVMGEDGLYFDPYSTDSFTKAFAQFVRERRDGSLSARVERLRQRSEAFTYDRMFNQIVATMQKL